MHKTIKLKLGNSHPWHISLAMFLALVLITIIGIGLIPDLQARAQGDGGSVGFDRQIDPQQWYQDHEVENTWIPDYLNLATGDPSLLTSHGVYEWPFGLDSIGWNMQSYQYYGGNPYFHHGMDMMKIYGTKVYNRSGGQVVNIENYGYSDLYWEVAVLDPDGYIWQYHHIDRYSIPDDIWDRWNEYQLDPINGGFIEPDTHIGDIVNWPVEGFHHIHLNILAAGGVYVNGFAFHVDLPDTDAPEIQEIGLLKNHQIVPGDEIEGNYSLYVHARDLILDHVHDYYLPPWEVSFSVDCGQVQTTWRFDTLPGGADRYAYLEDFYIVPPTCGDYDCRDYYIDLGFIPGSLFDFPTSSGEHTVFVTIRDYAGNTASQSFTYNVIGSPDQPPVADPQSVSTDEDSSAAIMLTGMDPNHDPISFTIVSTPTHGILGGVAPSLIYTPTINFNGNDSFSFLVSDCKESSDPAVVDINVMPVNDAPTGDSQALLGSEDAPLGILLTGSDPEYDPLTFTVVSTPTHGILGGIAPNLAYTPALNFNGEDSFSFVVNDGHENSEPVWVSIVVTPVNDAPVAYPQAVTTRQSAPVAITLSGSDIEGDELTYLVSFPPGHGLLSGIAPNLIYTPAPGYAGKDGFSFHVNDGELDSAYANVTITINYGIFLPVITR
jgi:hypothetical protein